MRPNPLPDGGLRVARHFRAAFKKDDHTDERLAAHPTSATQADPERTVTLECVLS